ncbi:hypothetical protein ABIF97_001477 [Bradyrhizobium japonicum]
MSELHSYLTDGFSGDHVVVRINGQTIFDKSGVTTKKLYGLAEQLQPIQVPGSNAKVEVHLPDKNIAATFDVDLSKGSHVPISLEAGQLSHSVQKQIGFM